MWCSRQGREESIDEAMHVGVGVVEWHGGYTKYVRLAPVAQSSLRNQAVADETPALPDTNRKLRSTTVRRTRREHGEALRRVLIKKKLQVAGQGLTFLPKLLHSGSGEDFERST